MTEKIKHQNLFDNTTTFSLQLLVTIISAMAIKSYLSSTILIK